MVDDQLIARAGIAALLAEMPGVVLVGQADTPETALEVIAERKPDAILLDLQLRQPGDGLEVLRRLKARGDTCAVIVLSASTDAESAEQALRMGAVAYVSKDFVIDELAYALRSAMAGRRHVSANVAVRHADPGAVELSPRQAEVLAGIARGRSNKELARELGITLKTVAYHRAELIRRLDLHDVASLTRHALARGLVGR
ncbi:MAG: response regulator transcription factor [Burkholderiaceae bacterium]|nr:response regulator transcription factor [Rhodoferax sp.]MCP5285186.1 response regulator transcription factor [Burkholderiaceae bacterium]